MKPISRRELIRRCGLWFEGPFSGGRHSFMKRGQLKLHVPNPHEGNISVPLLKEILKQASISINDWQEKKVNAHHERPGSSQAPAFLRLPRGQFSKGSIGSFVVKRIMSK